MPQKVRGVVARKNGEPVSVETIIVPDPGPGEAVVKVQACGVCHTDLHYRGGGINDELPFLLGHEAAGIVEAVGEGVTDVEPGDYVILNWRAVDGTCRACRRGEPWYCVSTHNAAQKMTLESGQELSPADGNGANVVVDAVGCPETVKQAFYARDLVGTAVLVGVPTSEMTIDLPLIDVFGRGGAAKSSWYGDCLPSRDFPMLIDKFLASRLPLDKFVSETIPLDGVEAAFEKVQSGKVLRSVVVI